MKGSNDLKSILTKLLAREAFRARLQNQPVSDKARSWGTMIWDALNSSFGLWFLSAIFISGAGSLYSANQSKKKEDQQIAAEKRAEDKKAQDRIDRLAMEFSYRLSTTLIRLKEAEIALGQDQHQDRNTLRSKAFMPLVSSPDEQVPPLFLEFKTYSGLALLAELTTLVRAGEKAELRDIIARLSGVLNDKEIIDLSKQDGFRLLAGKLLKQTRHPRWETGFPYTDCKEENPFC